MVALTDSTGSITDTFEYDTYGNVTERTGDSFVIFGYNGRDGVVTDKNGLIYMRARYYSPEMRRFVNADILRGEISDSTSLNRYSYVNGNPVSFVDPFGLSADKRGTDKNTPNQYTSVDLNSDGKVDYYIYQYSYSYTTGWWFWKKTKTVTGNVYIYVNVDKDFFNNPENIPDGFNSKNDLMIGDLTSESNPNMYAYQAHKLNPDNRDYVIEIMQKYDNDFNTAWNRTNESLQVEWVGHHKYRMTSSAQNIDFDNAEEGKGDAYFEEKAKKRLEEQYGGIGGAIADVYNFFF